MKYEVISAAAIVLLGIGSQVQAADTSLLLNKANVINYEEIQMAKTAKDKAGDNQPLATFAQTLEADHKANEDALTALSRQKGIKIDGTPADVDSKVKAMDNLDGRAFDEAFLKDEVTGHEKAVALFEHARSQFAGDPEMELYIGQTLPVIKAHLEMAKDLEHHLNNSSSDSSASNKVD
jgi:putative membrane protein